MYTPLASTPNGTCAVSGVSVRPPEYDGLTTANLSAAMMNALDGAAPTGDVRESPNPATPAMAPPVVSFTVYWASAPVSLSTKARNASSTVAVTGCPSIVTPTFTVSKRAATARLSSAETMAVLDTAEVLADLAARMSESTVRGSPSTTPSSADPLPIKDENNLVPAMLLANPSNSSRVMLRMDDLTASLTTAWTSEART